MMLKLKNKESGYLSMGAIPKVKEDRDWGGCRKAILESRKHWTTLVPQKPTFQIRGLKREVNVPLFYNKNKWEDVNLLIK